MSPTTSAEPGMLRVGEALVDLLAVHYGVDTVFGIPGVHNIEIYRGLRRSGVRAVSPRHEQGAGFMADGYTVVTGRPGVCCLISGPGLTNALTPIAQAFHDSRPMLVLASTTPTHSLGRRFGSLHDLDDQSAVARSVTAFSETVLDPAELPGLIARAWDVFKSARPRPVHLAIPTDVLASWTSPFAPVAPSLLRPEPDAASLAAAASLLHSADNPMIIAGGGAIDAGIPLARLAERLDAPVVLTGNAKGVIGSMHPLCVGSALISPTVRAAIEAADVVLVVGSEVSDSDLVNGDRPLDVRGRVVRIDIDADQLDRRMAPVVGIVADAAVALDALDRAVAALTPRRVTATRPAGDQVTAALQAAWRAEIPEHFRPWLTTLAAMIPDESVVALDSTQLAYAASRALSRSRPRQWLAPYGYGTLGCALPMAIGAAAADPLRPVVAIAGDGGWLFTVAEMATAADLGLPVLLIVWDNRGYGEIRASFDRAGAERMGVDVTSHDPVAIARGFGWAATSVTSPSELWAAGEAALVAGGPHFIRIEVPQ